MASRRARRRAANGSNYLLALRSEQAEQVKAERTRKAELKAAAALVSDQLSNIAAAAKMVGDGKGLPEKSIALPLNAWNENKTILAREMSYAEFKELRVALFRAEAFRAYWQAALTETPRDRSKDGKSFLDSMMPGINPG